MQAKMVEPKSQAENQAISEAFDRTACKDMDKYSQYTVRRCTDYWLGVNSFLGENE